jgi:hypothetical protein
MPEKRLAARVDSAAWLSGCLVVWLSGCLVVWLQLGPKLLIAATKANSAISTAAELLKAREDRQHKSDLEKAHRSCISELSACKQRLEELKSTVSRNGINSDDIAQAISKADALLATARLAGDALAANTDESRYESLVANFQGAVTALSDAISRAAAEAARRAEEKAASARIAEEAKRKTQLARVRKELSEAASAWRLCACPCHRWRRLCEGDGSGCFPVFGNGLALLSLGVLSWIHVNDLLVGWLVD